MRSVLAATQTVSVVPSPLKARNALDAATTNTCWMQLAWKAVLKHLLPLDTKHMDVTAVNHLFVDQESQEDWRRPDLVRVRARTVMSAA